MVISENKGKTPVDQGLQNPWLLHFWPSEPSGQSSSSKHVMVQREPAEPKLPEPCDPEGLNLSQQSDLILL